MCGGVENRNLSHELMVLFDVNNFMVESTKTDKTSDDTKQENPNRSELLRPPIDLIGVQKQPIISSSLLE